jgi:serine/threonine-protein kinase
MPLPEADAADSSLMTALRAALSGRYHIERELGRGGAATVFLGRDLRHARMVAVKVLASDAVAVGGTERFLREISTAARLTHPHILGLHDSGRSGGLLYYVMPYIDGESLRDRLTRSGALPLPEAVRLMRELAGALAYAHAHGVVHRDLKPENVLLSAGHAVIADFGIAKALAEATASGTTAPGVTATGIAVGTPAYMAPEQAVGDRHIDQRADLYALGVVAYEMLAGVHPFGARNAQAHVVAHLTESPVPLDARRAGIPPTIGAVVMHLLAKDPGGRPQSAQAVIDTLEAAAPTIAPASKPGGRRRGGVMVALVALALLGGYVASRRMASSHEDAARQADAIRTVAVIPFENTSGNQDDDYFSSGLTDELAHALTQIPGLLVAGRTSSYTFKGKAVPAQEIGRTLDVDAIVVGAVRRAGDRLRVTTQLVGTRDGKVLWDSVYESHSRDVFAVQDEFTRAIAAALVGSLGDRSAALQRAGSARGTTSGEAYDLFLRGQFFFLARGPQNVLRSLEYFHQAIAKDPSFARAYGALAMAYSTLPVYLGDPGDSLRALARANAERAIALDSTVADAQLAIAVVYDDDLMFAEAEQHYRASLALDPTNANAHLAYGFSQLSIGRTEAAERELREAVRIDPLLKSARTALALALLYERRIAESIAESRGILEVDSTFPLAYPTLAMALVMSGEADSAVQILERSEPYTRNLPMRRKQLLFAYGAAGRWRDVERLRDEARRSAADLTGALDAAFAELLLGDRDPLVRLLTTREGQRRWVAESGFGCNPLIDPLWSDERFAKAMRTLGTEPCLLARPWPFSQRR